MIIHAIFGAVRALKPLEINTSLLVLFFFFFLVSACQDFIKIAAIRAQLYFDVLVLAVGFPLLFDMFWFWIGLSAAWSRGTTLLSVYVGQAVIPTFLVAIIPVVFPLSSCHIYCFLFVLFVRGS